MSKSESRILSIEQAAEMLPLSKWTLYRLAKAREAPFHKRGGRWMAVEQDLLEWVRGRPKRADPMPSSKNPEKFPWWVPLTNGRVEWND